MSGKGNYRKLAILLVTALMITTAFVAITTTAKYEDDRGPSVSGEPGERQGTVECPDNSMFCQLPNLPNEWWIGYSAVDVYYIPYDNFQGLTDKIAAVYWWGADFFNDPSPLVFNIEFWTDDGGEPGTLVASFEGVTPTYTDTGLDYCGLELFEFYYELPTPVEMEEGWISICIDYFASNNRWFLWWGSDDGDLSGWLWTYYGGLEPIDEDLSFALIAPKWSGWNIKMHYPQGPDEDGWDVRATTPVTVADDWMATETSYVSDIHWWGSWKNGAEGTLNGFTVRIYADDGGVPGELLWERYVPIDEINVTEIEADLCPGGPGPYDWQICLEDTYGDGWNGGSIDVYVNDVLVYDDLTLLNGTGPECYPLTVYPGDLIDVYYTPGSWAYENIYYIVDQCGDEVVRMQPYYDGDLEDFEVPYYEPQGEGWYDPYEDESIYPDHTVYYQYDWENIDDPFLQWKDNIYWLAITADVSCGVWGWKTSEDHWNNDAMWKSLSRGERDTLLSEGFEDCYPGGIPPTWLMLTNDSYEYGEWEAETYYVHSGNYSVEGDPGSPYSIPHSDAWLISERRSLSSSPGDLTFWYRSESDNHWVKFHVLVSTSPDPYDYSAYTIVADLNASSTTWTEASIDMSAYANQDVYIAWRMYDSDVGYFYMFIDDVALDGWTEGFEGEEFPPAGWTMEVVSGTDSDNYWKAATNDSYVHPDYDVYEGDVMAWYECYWISSGNSARLYTPPLDFSGYQNCQLKFYMHHSDSYSWYTDNLTVQVSTDGVNWEDLETFYQYDPANPGWVEHIIDLSGYDGEDEVYIGFLGTSDYGGDICIDSIEITGETGAPPAEWTELYNPEPPYESLDMAFAIEGRPRGSVHNVNTDKWFTTIQDAIDDPETQDGHTIIAYLPLPEVFPSGKYEENINIHKSIILVANATEAPTLPPSVIIDGGQAGPTVTISADDVVIDGFEIINGTYGIYSDGTSGSSITNCIIHDNLNGGIELENSYGNTIAGCNIYGEGTGVHLVGSDGNALYDNEIGEVTTGIILEDSVLNYIHDNVFGDYSTGVWCLSNDDTNYINFNAFGKPCALKNVAIQNDDDVVVEAQYNWYGQDDGPGGYVADAVTGRIADGDGEKLVGNLHFDPWIGIDAKIVTDHIAVLEGEVIYFDASESFHCDASGSLQDDLRYEWDLGDGSRQFLKSFGYVYDEPGVYKVTLHVSAPDPIDEDNGVLDDFATVYITVSARGQPLKADAHPEEIYGDSGDYYYGDVGEPILFYGLATGGVPDYTFEWDFGDGTTAVGQNPVHAYSEEGIYTVTLTVTDSEGNIATDTAIAVIGTTEEQPSEGGVNISCIKGGFGIKATINNTLDEPVDWSIDVNVSGFGFIFIGGHANGTIPAGTEETVSSGLIFGIGKIDIVVTADDVTKEATGFLLGPFVLGVKEA